MILNEEKENIQQLLYSNNDKKISINSIRNYFYEIGKDLISKNDNKSEFISLDLLKSYFHLPYYLTKLIYSNIFKANEVEQMNLQSFVDGMINLYFTPIQEKIKIYFDFFDVLNIGKIYTNDIVLILKHFHLLTKNNNFLIFEQFIKYSFQFYLNLELTYVQWETLIKENSDIFILIIFFFDKFKPFNYENINYLLKSNNKSRKHSINVTSLENTFIKSNNYSQISDCSNILYIYLNKTFNLNLEYKENFTDYEHDLDSLDIFENDKNEKFNNLYEESGINLYKNLLNNNSIIKSENQTLNNTSYKNLFVRREKKKQFITGIIKKSSLIENNGKKLHFPKIINIDFQSGFLNSEKLECFSLNNDKKINYIIYLINNDLFVFRLRNQNDKIGFFDSLISLMNTIPVLDNEYLETRYIYILKLYSNNLRCYNKKSNNNIIHFKSYLCEKKEQAEKFINEIKKIFNFGDKFSNYFETSEVLIEGISGKYYKCINKENLNNYIVKIIKRKKINKNNVQYIRNEIDIYEFINNIKNENLLNVFGFFEEKSHLFFIYEPPYDKLINHINSFNNKIITSILNYLNYIINSLSFLHSFGFIYDDILMNNIYVFKYENIFIPKLFMFEQIKLIFEKEILKENFYNNKRKNNPDYPIEISSGLYYNNLSDSWQLGLLIYYLLFQNHPFQFNKKTKEINYELEIPENLNFEISKNEIIIYKKLNDLIISCLDNEFENRPSMKEIISNLSNDEN